MFAKLFGGLPENITINISSLSVINHFNFKIGKEAMKTLTELLAEIETIATAGSASEVQAQVDSLKETVAANTAAIAENDANDEATKELVANQQTIIETLIDKLAAAPAPSPAPVADNNA